MKSLKLQYEENQIRVYYDDEAQEIIIEDDLANREYHLATNTVIGTCDQCEYYDPSVPAIERSGECDNWDHMSWDWDFCSRFRRKEN